MYFDANATTPLRPAAREAWLRLNDAHWHNASGLYREAGAARRLLEECRERLAETFAIGPERVVFTSGATEANNAVVAWHASRARPEKALVMSPVEHPSVREPVLAAAPGPAAEWPLDARGVPDLDWLASQLSRETPALVSLMAANNETGTLHPWREVRDQCRERGVPFHCDAAQWIGKEPLDALGEDGFVVGCGHKFGGPKGVGFLLLPEAVAGSPGFRLAIGGPQENRRRAGTEDLAAIGAMVAALEQAALSEAASPHGREAFEARLLAALPGTRLVGAGAPRLANTSLFVLPRHPNLRWLTRLSQRGFALSTGSACSAGKGAPSHVMAAHGLEPDAMGRVLRASALPGTDEASWLALAEAIAAVGEELDGGHRQKGAPLPA